MVERLEFVKGVFSESLRIPLASRKLISVIRVSLDDGFVKHVPRKTRF